MNDSGSPISFVKERCISQDYVTDRADRDQFYGLNSSGLKILGCIEVTLVYEDRELNIMLRVVSGTTVKSPLVLGRDFIKLAKLTLKIDSETGGNANVETCDIVCIELDAKDLCATSQVMRINEDLPSEVKQQACDLFQKHYVNAKRRTGPAVESKLKLILMDGKPFSCTPRRLSYYEKEKLRKNGETRMCITGR